MNSFYGGPRGAGVEIVATVADAAALSNLTNINYGQYIFVQSENALYRKTREGYEKALTFSIDTATLNTPIVFDSYDTVAAMTGATEKQYTLDDDFVVGANVLSFVEAYDSTNNTNYIGLKIPAPALTLTSASNNLTITPAVGSTPFNQEFLFTLTNGNNVVSELSDFRDYTVDGQRDIYNPDDDTIITNLTMGARILIYQKHSIVDDQDVYRWYYFGSYNGVSSVVLSNTGLLTITDYNNTQQTFQVKDIASVSLTDDKLKITYNDDTPQHPSYNELTLVYPTALSYDDATAIISVTNSSGTTSDLSPEINYIKSAVLTDDYHWIVYYSSPSYRDEHKNYTYDNPDDPGHNTDEWVDYGCVRQDNGMLVGMNLSPQVIGIAYSTNDPTRAQIIEYLNNHYSSGYEGGKLITVGDEDDEKEVYGFNYNTDAQQHYLGWYYVGIFATIDETNPASMVVAYDDHTAATQTEMLERLELGGLWFVETLNPNA